MIRTRKTGAGTVKYEVRAYNPATRRTEYVGVRYQKGTKSHASRQDPAVYAFALEHEAERRYRDEFDGVLSDDAPPTLRELREQWVAARTHPQAERRWRPQTEKHNVERTTAVLARFGDVHPDAIKRPDAMAWVREHPRNVDQARALVNWARDEGLCTLNPFERPGISKGRGRKDDAPLTEDDLAALDAACSVLGKYADPMRGWLYFAAYVGLRPAEGLGLLRSDLDLKARRVHIREQKYPNGTLGPTKNGRERTVSIPGPALKHLHLIPTRLGSPWLLHNRSGAPLLYGSLLGYWDKIMVGAGLASDRRWLDAEGNPRGVDPYHLRHFCGSHLADLGATAQDVATQLGHTDGGKLAQEVYIHTYEERSLARLDDLYEQAPPRHANGEGERSEGVR